MNDQRRFVIVAASIVIAGMFLFPPWTDGDMHSLWYVPWRQSEVFIDYAKLAMQASAAVVIAAAALALSGGNQKRAGED